MIPLVFFSIFSLGLFLFLGKSLYFSHGKLGTQLSFNDFGRKICWLSHVSSLSTLTGLLGTVLGIKKAFQNMMESGNLSVETFSAGIGQALITTIFGLSIAIPSLLFYHIFLDRLEQMEEQSGKENRN